MATPDFIAALVSYLKADTDVYTATGGRVYGGELPDAEAINQPRGAIVLRATGGGFFSGRSFMELNDPRVDIMCYGSTPYQAGVVFNLMHPVLKQMRRNVTGNCLLHWCHPTTSPQQLRDPDAEWPMILSVWQVLYSEREVA